MMQEIYNNRGLLKSDTGDKEGALVDYNRAIELDPDGIKAYNNRGVLKRNKGDEVGGLADF